MSSLAPVKLSCKTEPPVSIRGYGVAIFEAQARALAALASSIDNDFDQVIDLILNCHGRVMICGMGKSSLVRKNMSVALHSGV